MSAVAALAPSAAITAATSYDMLITFLLVMTRILAFLMIAPPFNSKGVPQRVKVTLAGAMALPVTPALIGTAHFADMWALAGAVVYHLLTGALLGYVALLVLSAVQAAGDLVDIFSMFTMASILDPLSNTQSAIFGRIQNLIGTTILFASGGHLLMFRGLMTGFELAPLHPPAFQEVGTILVGNFMGFLVSALEIAAPIVAVLVIADIALGLVSRAVPSLNIFQLAFPVKTVLTVALASTAVSLLPAAVSGLLDHVVTEMPQISKLLGG